MTDLVYHTTYDGEPSMIRRTLDRALQEVAVNALSYGAGGAAIGDIDEEIGQMAQGYSDLLGSELVPSLGHMLALEYQGQDYASVIVEIHDMDTPIGHDSQVGEYNMFDPPDASFWLIEALYSTVTDKLTEDEGFARLKDNLRRMLQSRLQNGNETTIEVLRSNERLFGYPLGDRRNLFWDDFEADSPVLKQILERAGERFSSLLSEIRPDSPKP